MTSKQILPSRMALQNLKTRLTGAKKGYELLKKKADALKSAFRKIMLQILDVKKSMGKDFSAAMLTLAEANYAAGEFSRNVQDQVKAKSSIRLMVTSDNIAGVHLPTFQIKNDVEEGAGDESNPLGLHGGGQVIQKCREQFRKFLDLIVKIASLQTAFITLDEVIKVTNRRVNALEYVVVPRLGQNVNYIIKELDEQDREDFFRLKKVTDNKKKVKEQSEKDEGEKIQKAKDDAKKAAGAGKGEDDHKEEPAFDPHNFGEEEDESSKDIIF